MAAVGKEGTLNSLSCAHPASKGRLTPTGRGSASDKSKQRETLPVLPIPTEAPGNGIGEGSEQQYERGLLPSGYQLSERPGTELHKPPRTVQKNKNTVASPKSKEVGPLPQAPPTSADCLSYDHAVGDCFRSYFEPGPSGASDIACEGGQTLGSSRAIVNHYPTSARITTTNKDSSLALMADSRSVMPGTKPRMITLGRSAPWDG
jgi:hypothetical protein